MELPIAELFKKKVKLSEKIPNFVAACVRTHYKHDNKMKCSVKIIAPALLALFFSCSKEEAPVAEYAEITVYGEDASKTALHENAVVWSGGDKMRVFSTADATGKLCSLSRGEGTSTGNFYGEIPAGDTFFAVYPSTATYNGSSTFTFTLPAVVEYTEGSFAPGSNPMLSATSNDITSFSMKNLCGVLRLRLTGTIDVSSLELSFAASVSGTGTVARGGNTLTMTGSSAADRKVTMTCPSDMELDEAVPVEFYFVLPAGEYDGMTIRANMENGNYATKSVSTPFTITRSQITTLSGLMPPPSLSTRPELTVWSFNVACQKNDDNSGWDSSHYWSVRKPGIYAFFNEMSPDIIGTQECEYRQRVNILDNTSGYAAYGLGEDYGKESSGSSGSWWNKKDYNTDSSNAIFYKTSKFDIIDKGTFWLSNDPSSVGSNDGHCCSWIKFRWKENGYVFYFFNTHFTAHYTDEAYAARLAEAVVLYDQLEAINTEHLPMIVVGDLNESASDICNPEKGDSRWSNYYFARNQDGKTSKTSYPTSYNGFDTSCSGFSTIYSSGTSSGNRSNLDHIFYRYCYENSKHGLKAGTFGTDYRTYSSVQYISDHWPITATLVFDYQ